MWTYWALREGTLKVDPGAFTTSSGGFPPVVHVDSDAPLYDDIDGSLITDEMWGIYFKPDFSFGGSRRGRALHRRPAIGRGGDRPLRPGQPEFTRRRGFTRMWTSGLAHSLKRFEKQRHLYSKNPPGASGRSPGQLPVFDTFCENAYVIVTPTTASR